MLLGYKAQVPVLTDTVKGEAREWFQQRDKASNGIPFELGSLQDRVSFWCMACRAAKPYQDYAYSQFVSVETERMARYWRTQSLDQKRSVVADLYPLELEERKTPEGDLVTDEYAVVPFEQASWLMGGTRSLRSGVFPVRILTHRSAHQRADHVRDQVLLRKGQVYVPLDLLEYVLVEHWVRFLQANRAVFAQVRQQWIQEDALPWIADLETPLSALEVLHHKQGCTKPLDPNRLRRPPCIVSMDTKLARPEHLKFEERKNYAAYFASLAHPDAALQHMANQWRPGLQKSYGSDWEAHWKTLKGEITELPRKIRQGTHRYGCPAMTKTGHCLWTRPPAEILTRLTSPHEHQIPHHKLTTLRSSLMDPKKPPKVRCGQLLQVYGVRDTSFVQAPWEFSVRE